MMQSHRSTPKDGWITGENGQIYGAARPQDIERYIFLTAILHRGLRNDFFFIFQYRFTFSNFCMDFSVPFIFGLFFPFSIWTFLSLFYLDFSIPFLFGLFNSLFSWSFFPFSFWTFISLFTLFFRFSIWNLFLFSIWTFISLFYLDFFPLFYLDFYFPFLFGFFSNPFSILL